MNFEEVEAEVVWGERQEPPIAAAVAEVLWPGSSLVRLPQGSHLDWFAYQGNVVVGALEIKVRRCSVNAHTTVWLPATKRNAALQAQTKFRLPSWAVLLYSDALGYLPLLAPVVENFVHNRDGRDREVPHVAYARKFLKLVNDEVYQGVVKSLASLPSRTKL